MNTKSFSEMPCSIAQTLESVGSWWSLLIVRDAMMGARRFKDFERSLGISKNTLTNRLNDLVRNGILKRVSASDGTRYEEYVLTPAGLDLAPVLIALAQWGDEWAAHPDGPTFAFHDAQTDETISRVWPRRGNGEKIKLRDLRFRSLNRFKNETAKSPKSNINQKKGRSA